MARNNDKIQQLHNEYGPKIKALQDKGQWNEANKLVVQMEKEKQQYLS